MGNKGKNIFTAVIITVVFLAVVVGYFAIFIVVPSFWFRLISFIVLIGITFAMIFVLRERIKEIKKGEMDDLSKY